MAELELLQNALVHEGLEISDRSSLRIAALRLMSLGSEHDF